MEKRKQFSSGAIFSFLQYFLPVVKFSCLSGTRFSIPDKRLFEISEVEITRVNSISNFDLPGQSNCFF